MLAAHRDTRQEFLRQPRFDVDVCAEGIAVFIELVARLKARESLRTRRLAGDGSPIVRGGFARFDAVTLTPPLDAERHVERLGQRADFETAHHAGVERELVVVHFAGIETRLRIARPYERLRLCSTP